MGSKSRTDPMRQGDTLHTENQESCTTYNMLKVGLCLLSWSGIPLVLRRPFSILERMTSFSGSLRWGATPGLTSLCNFAFNSGFRLQEVSTYSIWRVVIFAPIWLVRWALSQIARTLFRWTKDIKYMDYYERALVNGVLGIQRGQQPGVMIYMLPMAPGSSKARSYHGWGNKFASFWCCYGTGILFTIWVFIAFFHYFRCIFITLRPSIALAFLLEKQLIGTL